MPSFMKYSGENYKNGNFYRVNSECKKDSYDVNLCNKVKIVKNINFSK